MTRKFLYSAALFYLALPVCIFLLSWTTLWAGIPLAIATVAACLYIVRDINGLLPSSTIAKTIGILLIIAAWVTIGGIGGYVWQNRWDHICRNALFADLVANPWPVVKGGEMMVYYLAYWLPAALLAKITGSMAVGYAVQWLWGVAGIAIALWIMYDFIGKVRFSTILLIMLAGTIDIFPFLMRRIDVGIEFPIENWNPIAFLEWPDSMIFWVYNQFIPSMVGCMMIFRLRSASVSVFVMAMLLLSAPFSEVLLAPVSLYFIYKRIVDKPSPNAALTTAKPASNRLTPAHILRACFSPINVYALLMLLVLGSYVASNHASGHFGINMTYFTDNEFRPYFWKMFVALLIFSFGVWMPFIWRTVSRDPLFLLMSGAYLVCLFLVLGSAQDFASRSVLPLVLYILLMLAQRVADDWHTMRTLTKAALIALICCSAITPASDIRRIAYGMTHDDKSDWRAHDVSSVFVPILAHDNFTGDEDAWPFRRR